jgi:hypothetical protein
MLIIPRVEEILTKFSNSVDQLTSTDEVMEAFISHEGGNGFLQIHEIKMAGGSGNRERSSTGDERRRSISLSMIHRRQSSGGSESGEESVVDNEFFFIGIDFGTTFVFPLPSSFILVSRLLTIFQIYGGCMVTSKSFGRSTRDYNLARQNKLQTLQSPYYHSVPQ